MPKVKGVSWGSVSLPTSVQSNQKGKNAREGSYAMSATEEADLNDLCTVHLSSDAKSFVYCKGELAPSVHIWGQQ